MQKQATHDIIRPLTGLRAVTIAWVTVNHLSVAIKILTPALKPFVLLSERITVRMDLLFLLSGFLMAYVYIRRNEQMNLKGYGRFLWARIARIYPAYLAAVLVLILEVSLCRLLHFPINPDHYRLQVLPFRLALLQAWPYFSDVKVAWNYPTWFLSALWFAYLFAIPCVWKMFPKIRVSRFSLLWVFTPILAYMLLREFAGLREFFWVLQASCEIIAGGALCAVYLKRKPLVAAMQKHLDKIVLVFLVSFVLIVLIPSPLAAKAINLLLLLVCPLLLMGLTAERSLISNLLATRPFLWLGEISYSLFVSHMAVVMPLGRLLPPERFASSPVALRYALVAFEVFAVLIVAVAFYKFVEVPCAKALKQLSVKRLPNPFGKSKPIPQQVDSFP